MALGYHRSVLTDEVHAYLIGGTEALGPSIRGPIALKRQLRAIFRDARGRIAAVLSAGGQSSTTPNRAAM